MNTFEDILPYWTNELWVGRVSKIEHMSSLKWNSYLWFMHGNVEITKDHSIFDKYTPTFFNVKVGDEIIGVNSGFKTDDKIYRSRGLWVKPEHRGNGHSKTLLKQTIEQGRKEGCTYIWTMPRKTALPAYESVGFNKIGGWIDEKVEFGPNCIAMRKLINI